MRTDNDLRSHHHGAGFSIPLPPTWDLAEDPRPEVALVAAEPTRDDRFRANLVVTLEHLAGWDLPAWQDSTETMLAATLHDYVLLDLERLDRPGLPGLRRLCHHVVAGTAVTLEQWCHDWDGYGLTLSASTPTLDHPDLRDVLAAAAEGWAPDDGTGR